MVTFWSVEASLDSAWYTDVLLYTIETHLKVEIVVVVSDNLWKFDTIPDMSGVWRDLRKGRNGLGKCNNFKIFCYILRWSKSQSDLEFYRLKYIWTMDAFIRIASLSKGDPCKPCDNEFQECDSYIIHSDKYFYASQMFLSGFSSAPFGTAGFSMFILVSWDLGGTQNETSVVFVCSFFAICRQSTDSKEIPQLRTEMGLVGTNCW